MPPCSCVRNSTRTWRARDAPTFGRSSLVRRSSAAELEADADADLHALRAQPFDQNLVAALRFGDVAVAITHVREVPCSKVDGRPAPHHHERPVLRLAQIGAELDSAALELARHVGAAHAEGHFGFHLREPDADGDVGMPHARHRHAVLEADVEKVHLVGAAADRAAEEGRNFLRARFQIVVPHVAHMPGLDEDVERLAEPAADLSSKRLIGLMAQRGRDRDLAVPTRLTGGLRLRTADAGQHDDHKTHHKTSEAHHQHVLRRRTKLSPLETSRGKAGTYRSVRRGGEYSTSVVFWSLAWHTNSSRSIPLSRRT